MLSKIIPGSTFTVNSLLKKVNIKDDQVVDWLSGGCMLFEKSLLDKIGKMDEDYFLGVEDIDFCYRAKKAGMKTLYVPSKKVLHYHGYSSGGTRSTKRIEMDRDGIDTFLKKHFPEKKIARAVIRFLHNLKIRMLL